MIRIRGTIIYDGGERAEWSAGPREIAAWEAYARRQGFDPTNGQNNATMTLFLAYKALHVREGFDVWIDSVYDLEQEDTAAEEVDPFPSEATVE